ncbi:MAG: 3-dehydroquinate synthase [Bacteroidota bacterium]
MQNIHLQDYSIFIGEVWNEWHKFLKQNTYSKILVLTDENTHQYCFPLLQENTPKKELFPIKITSGEQNKGLRTCEQVWAAMLDANVDRKALMVNLGGGVIGDMGGFCASTYKRGIDFVQFPTTLLSQVDASIGGKLGIDFNNIKNSIGVFRNPQAVFILPQFFDTLPKREIRSGFAEIIKHSLIADDTEWDKLKEIKDLKQVQWIDFLYDSLLIKKRVVEIDPFEQGLRKALNFGHTIGHAVESYFLSTKAPLLHGEAIAIGMICESYLSHKKIDLSKETLHEITDFLLQIYGHQPIPEAEFPNLIDMMRKDKKNENNQINFSLIQPIGKIHINQTAKVSLIEESIVFYNGLVG